MGSSPGSVRRWPCRRGNRRCSARRRAEQEGESSWPSRRSGNVASVGGIELTHADRPLWPGVTKKDLAEYWAAVAEHALPGLVRRPLAIVRCPEGIEGEHFFQKHGHGAMPPQIREGTAERAPYLAIDGAEGLIALAQMSAIELHPWGATEADPTHPDRLVFDLDPGEGVAFPAVVKAAHEVRERLQRLGLQSFCRTTGGKGLHVVVPLTPQAAWDEVRPWCQAFAVLLSEEQPDQYLSTLSKAERRGRILIDWLRNGLGPPRCRPSVPAPGLAQPSRRPLAWSEVTPQLDPAAFTIRTVPDRIGRLRKAPWAGFDTLDQRLPERKAARPDKPPAPGGARIVHAPAPKRGARG